MPSRTSDRSTGVESHTEDDARIGSEDKKQQGHQDRKQQKQKASSNSKDKASKPQSKDGVGTSGSRYSTCNDCTGWEDPDHLERNLQEYKRFKENNKTQNKESKGQHDTKSTHGQKRGLGANAETSNKKSKLDEPRGAAGDKTRVPRIGQKVQWHALPGYVDGEVVEVVYEGKEVEGKKIKASKEDPRIVLRSFSSGKICVHKPEVVYFD